MAHYDGDDAVWSLASGDCTEFLGFRHPRHGNVGGLTEELNTTLYVEDTLNDPNSDPEIQARVQMRSLITAPLHRDGTVVGILAAMARKPGAFDALAVEAVTLMAEFVSALMRNAEELESRQVLVGHLEVQGREVEESEERFRSAFFAATIGMSLTDLERPLRHGQRHARDDARLRARRTDRHARGVCAPRRRRARGAKR